MAAKLTFCFYVATGLVLIVTQTQAQACVNGFQCLSCTQAQICVGGVPSGAAITCPATTYCLNTNAQVCTVGSCPTFTCTVAGRFPDPNNSSQYIICVPDPSQASGLLRITIPCPAGSTFSPTALQCVLITATTTTATTTTPIYSCASIGRYPDARNCSIYYMCQTNPAGGFYVYKYTCPATTLFNSAIQKCTTAATSGCVIAG
ncbi:hypothetical protein J437_LFUL007946 [Ladona fulva]|uniref:Chitin-binding type-2 domain-containing protein n=1 Tax=Ladona fulva TaxID=123851 RepID=A0A8K0P2I1_LADFU|nr:hypothetical protein J437_LFUL007946 [Ladona fulva]